MWADAMKILREKIEVETRRKINQFRKFEGLDYTDVDNQWRRDNLRQLNERDLQREKLLQFGFALVIGATAGSMAWFIIAASAFFHDLKTNWVLAVHETLADDPTTILALVEHKFDEKT